MRLVADASSLVGELVRRRGQELVAHPALELYIAEPTYSETRYELRRRVAAMVRRGRMTVAPVPPAAYAAFEAEARRRIPRDPADWPTVALALALDAAIWTHDSDFLGCGLATWTTGTLLAWLER